MYKLMRCIKKAEGEFKFFKSNPSYYAHCEPNDGHCLLDGAVKQYSDFFKQVLDKDCNDLFAKHHVIETALYQQMKKQLETGPKGF